MTYISGKSITAIGAIFPILGMLTLGLRYYVRITKRQRLGPDDWLSVTALIFTIGAGVVLIHGSAKNEFGSHVNPATVTNVHAFKIRIIELQKLDLAFTLTQYLALGFTKLSILFFYRRIFFISRTFNICSWALAILSIIWTAAWFFLAVFQCGRHVPYLWGYKEAYSSRCMPATDLFVVNVVTDVALDLGVILLPIPLIWGLQMPIKQKLSVTAVFLLGAFSVAAGVTRLVIILYVEILDAPGAVHVNATDTLGISSLIYFWAYIEVGVAMVISCLITLRRVSDLPLFQTIATGVRSNFASLRYKMSGKRGSGFEDDGSKGCKVPGACNGDVEQKRIERTRSVTVCEERV